MPTYQEARKCFARIAGRGVRAGGVLTKHVNSRRRGEISCAREDGRRPRNKVDLKISSRNLIGHEASAGE